MIDYEKEIILISKKIRAIRKNKGLTIQELAYRCDIERPNMSRIEAGKTNLTIKTLCKICSALEIPLTDLIKNGG